eukprot:gb/GFBE01035107.1/.p1 GENE.gb/GFBE01035107.1/~~gb/GFBE01035107.1/.p1  ORF type:complete len:671 (+),score=131.93 gb/GFBE01035107.1/:1-2013(+)
METRQVSWHVETAAKTPQGSPAPMLQLAKPRAPSILPQGAYTQPLAALKAELVELTARQQLELRQTAESHHKSMLAAITLSFAKLTNMSQGHVEHVNGHTNGCANGYMNGHSHFSDHVDLQTPAGFMNGHSQNVPADDISWSSLKPKGTECEPPFDPFVTQQPEAPGASEPPLDPEGDGDEFVWQTFYAPKRTDGEESAEPSGEGGTMVSAHTAEKRRQAPDNYNMVKTTSNLSSTASQALNLERDNSRLDSAVGVVVLLNSFVMVSELEWQGSDMAVQIGLRESHGWLEAGPFFRVMEHVFTIFFVLEMLYRMHIERWKYCCKMMNLLDVFLVLTSCIDLYILTPLAASEATNSAGSTRNVILLRLMRVSRLARAVRIVRTLRLFRGLRVLVQACTSFLPSLCWSMVLLGLFMMMGGLMMGNLLQEYVSDQNEPLEDRMWVWHHYGTAYRAIYTMYEITFAGNWPVYARPVLEKVSHYFTVFYILYISVVVFAVIRVITAIFLRDTLDAANNDAEMLVQEKLAKKAKFVKNLECVFKATDTSGDGAISEDELLAILEDPKVKAYLHALDLEVHEGSALFHLLDDGSGQVTCDEFINGLLRFKGPARAIDQIAMHVDLKQLQNDVSALTSALEQVSVIRPVQRKERRQHTGDMKIFRHCGTGLVSHNSDI